MNGLIASLAAKWVALWSECGIYVALMLILLQASIQTPIVSNVLMEFFGISEKDGLVEGGVRVGETIVGRIIYVLIDYWVAIACAGFVGFLNYLGWDFRLIVLATWIFDFIVAAGFMFVSEKTGKDITLGKSLRRAVNVVYSSNKLVGYLSIAWINTKAIVWDGPEQVVIFFKKELGTVSRMVVLLAILTFFQGVFWAWVYSLGYESVSELLKSSF